jgi:hypothetical protein
MKERTDRGQRRPKQVCEKWTLTRIADAPQKFPVPVPRESGFKSLNLLSNKLSNPQNSAQNGEISLLISL